ncbi:protein lev-9-like isoform X4 [Uloborus diversus]|uniref:protein lev-9-like isoform X4 n=1 Tax=Uloborus diversus TaxID=327109 RepID=UPI00240A7E92|nr:protein lev-9-like isoform X4 [Uloborus diversus]
MLNFFAMEIKAGISFNVLKIAIFCRLIVPAVLLCHLPDYPKHGYYSPDKLSYSMGESITYSCSDGYNLLGKSTRTCEATGMWNGRTPFCDKPTQLSMPSWTTDKMVDGNKDTCHPIIHGMTFTLKNAGIVQAIRLHIPAQPETKITAFTIQDRVVKICNDYETTASEWCLFPPDYHVRSGNFEVSRDKAILHCSSDVKQRVGYMMCRNNTWTGFDLYCEKESETTSAASSLVAVQEISIQDCAYHNSNKVNILVATVIILVFSLLGLTIYEIWRHKKCSRMMGMKPSWSRMSSEECHI